MDALFNEIAHRSSVNAINRSMAREHAETFRGMAKVNQVIVPISIGSVAFLLLGDKDGHKDKLKTDDKEKIAIVVCVGNSVCTRDGNWQHYYAIRYPFSDTPEKHVLMTNQGWEPIHIPNRKLIEPTIESTGKNFMGRHEVIYEPVDYYEVFTKGEQELDIENFKI